MQATVPDATGYLLVLAGQRLVKLDLGQGAGSAADAAAGLGGGRAVEGCSVGRGDGPQRRAGDGVCRPCAAAGASDTQLGQFLVLCRDP